MTIIDPKRLTIIVHSKQTCGSADKANSKRKRARNRGSVLSLLLLSNRRAIESAREPERTKSDCQSLLRWPLNSDGSPGWGPYRNAAHRSNPGFQDRSQQNTQTLRLERCKSIRSPIFA